MKRASVFCIAISLCFIALDLKPEEPSLTKKVDHIFITSDRAQEPANPLLGRGPGVDHVGIAVRDLKKTRDDYEQVLGFKFMEIPPQPDGFVPYVIYFENTTYLELQPIAALPFIAKMFDYADGYADFKEKCEGAVFLGLATSSAKDAADHLKAPGGRYRI